MKKRIVFRNIKKLVICDLLSLFSLLQTMRRHRNEVTVELRKVRKIQQLHTHQTFDIVLKIYLLFQTSGFVYVGRQPLL